MLYSISVSSIIVVFHFRSHQHFCCCVQKIWLLSGCIVWIYSFRYSLKVLLTVFIDGTLFTWYLAWKEVKHFSCHVYVMVQFITMKPTHVTQNETAAQSWWLLTMVMLQSFSSGYNWKLYEKNMVRLCHRSLKMIWIS